jgi:hypothetical protein
MLPKTAWEVKLGHRRDVRCKTAFSPKADVHRRPCYVAGAKTGPMRRSKRFKKQRGPIDPLLRDTDLFHHRLPQLLFPADEFGRLG